MVHRVSDNKAMTDIRRVVRKWEAGTETAERSLVIIDGIIAERTDELRSADISKGVSK